MSEGCISNDEAEAKTYFGSWLRTQDIARVDEDGYLYIVDRVDNMIVTGGENVYPAEVERILEKHPDVEEACVFGLDDDHWGQVVTAVVVSKGDVTEEDVTAHCKGSDELADFKRPRQCVVTDEPLPRTDTGTLIRQELIEKHFS
jgi:fatty-acyl-CoA synthase